jgi:hypothetical protein
MLDLLELRWGVLVYSGRSPGAMICVHPQQFDMANVIQEKIEHIEFTRRSTDFPGYLLKI